MEAFKNMNLRFRCLENKNNRYDLDAFVLI